MNNNITNDNEPEDTSNVLEINIKLHLPYVSDRDEQGKRLLTIAYLTQEARTIFHHIALFSKVRMHGALDSTEDTSEIYNTLGTIGEAITETIETTQLHYECALREEKDVLNAQELR